MSYRGKFEIQIAVVSLSGTKLIVSRISIQKPMKCQRNERDVRNSRVKLAKQRVVYVPNTCRPSSCRQLRPTLRTKLRVSLNCGVVHDKRERERERAKRNKENDKTMLIKCQIKFSIFENVFIYSVIKIELFIVFNS